MKYSEVRLSAMKTLTESKDIPKEEKLEILDYLAHKASIHECMGFLLDQVMYDLSEEDKEEIGERFLLEAVDWTKVKATASKVGKTALKVGKVAAIGAAVVGGLALVTLDAIRREEMENDKAYKTCKLRCQQIFAPKILKAREDFMSRKTFTKTEYHYMVEKYHECKEQCEDAYDKRKDNINKKKKELKAEKK